MAGSSWDKIVEPLTESLKNRFSQLDNKDFIKFCTTNKDLRNVAENFLKSNGKPSVCKDSRLAEEKRIEGDVELEKKNYDKSVSLYTESIFYSCQNDENVALVFASRSKALLQLGHAAEALQDIEIALGLSHSKNNLDFKLQKCKCLMVVGDVYEAKRILSEGFTQQQSKDLVKSLQKEVKGLKYFEEDDFEIPEPVGGYNDNFASASAHLQLHYKPNRGRHVVASEDIQMGDVLFVEKPFAFVLFKEMCHNCCKKLVSPIPCWSCGDVFYCSPSCRDSHFKSIHSFECGCGEVFSSVGIAYLSLRIVLAASSSLKGLKSCVKKIKEVEYRGGIVSFKSRDYDCVYNLVSNFEKYEGSDLFQYVMTALLLALHLKTHTNYFENSSEDEDLTLLTSIITRHIMQLICNGHAIVDTFVERCEGSAVENETEERVGTAIYPSASMMNHSCQPTIINNFYKNCLVVRAARDIKKGEEVFNCYGPDARRMKRPERLEILRKQYFFNCDCTACTEPFDIQDKFTAFKCEKCKGPLIKKGEKKVFCIECKLDTEMSPQLSKNQIKFFNLLQEGELLLPHTLQEFSPHPWNINPSHGSGMHSWELHIFCVKCCKDSNAPIPILGMLLDPGIEVYRQPTAFVVNQGNNNNNFLGEILMDKDVGLALKKFIQSWLIGRKIFYKFNKNLSQAADEIAKCLAYLQDYKMCVKFLKCCILSVEKRFGSNSIELANETKKLADAIINDVMNNVSKGKEASKTAEEGIGYYNKAQKLFILLFGPHHPDVKEIERNKENLQIILKKYK